MRLVVVLLLVAYLAVIGPFTGSLRDRPVAVKLGYMPSADVLKPLAGDHAFLVAEIAILKVLFYFGELVEEWKNRVVIPPEYYNMFKTVETAVRLDPYNIDAYYFAQAAFTWEVGRAADVNRLLDFGMRYRTWDPYLPFFAGFNAGYFLDDPEAAAGYMQKAAEVSGEPLFASLASRYYHEAGRSEAGIRFLEAMEGLARDPRERRIYTMRKEALLAVVVIEEAVVSYAERFGENPADLRQLLAAGILERLPADPYGGEFYLDAGDSVRSTSMFVYRDESQE